MKLLDIINIVFRLLDVVTAILTILNLLEWA